MASCSKPGGGLWFPVPPVSPCVWFYVKRHNMHTGVAVSEFRTLVHNYTNSMGGFNGSHDSITKVGHFNVPTIVNTYLGVWVV
jgi:hypothetical protein